jgi:hypothetical protein
MTGYKEDRIKPEDWRFGASGDTILQADRDWRPFLPVREYQHQNGLETQGCTIHHTHNPYEILCKRLFGFEPNFSDRYLHIRSGTTQQGNSPHHVAEVFRKYVGGIPESLLPFSPNIDTWTKYTSGVSFGHKLAGITWLKDFEPTHEWVVDGTETNDADAIYDALQFSPVSVAGDAWNEENGIYVRKGMDNHWVTIVYAEKGKYFLAFDSYGNIQNDDVFKKLDWNYGFSRAKRYAMKKREGIDLQFKIRMLQGLSGIYV